MSQEHRRAVHTGPDRFGVVSDRDLQLLVVGALLDRSRQVDGGNAEDARQLPGLDPGNLTGGPVALRGDPGHDGTLALDEHGLGVPLAGLVGNGVARRENGDEEEHDTEERDAHPPQGSQGPHRPPSAAAGCVCSERDSAAPFRAACSTGSRCICSSFPILRDLSPWLLRRRAS